MKVFDGLKFINAFIQKTKLSIMKKLSCFVVTLFVAFCLQAQPPNIDAVSGMKFGLPVTEANAVKPADLTSLMADTNEATVKVKGKVVEVCKAEGCWLRMETANGSMLIKMKDHKFLVPVSLTGKEIIVEGKATMKEITVDMLKHYAEDAGKSAKEIAAITEPKKEIVLHASGILVL